jgi:hypothetical protein
MLWIISMKLQVGMSTSSSKDSFYIQIDEWNENTT